VSLIAAAILEALDDPRVAAKLRELLGSSVHGDVLPVSRAADVVGVNVRVLRDAARRGDLQLLGPRGARVVRRAELDRWLAQSAPMARPLVRADLDEDRTAFERSAIRLAGGVRR